MARSEGTRRVAVIGGGPAGLMAAETARAAGATVDVYERMGSVGRKFLIAGKGGLNLTHSDSFERFASRVPLSMAVSNRRATPSTCELASGSR